MTEADDTLSRLFRDPIAADRDEAFAARVAHEIATARRAAHIYQSALVFAAAAGLVALTVAVMSLGGVVSVASASLVADVGAVPSHTALAMAAAVAAAAIVYSQWVTRRSV